VRTETRGACSCLHNPRGGRNHRGELDAAITDNGASGHREKKKPASFSAELLQQGNPAALEKRKKNQRGRAVAIEKETEMSKFRITATAKGTSAQPTTRSNTREKGRAHRYPGRINEIISALPRSISVIGG